MDIYKNLPQDIRIIIDAHIRKHHFTENVLPMLIHRRKFFIKSYLNSINTDSLSADIYYWFNIPEEKWGHMLQKLNI